MAALGCAPAAGAASAPAPLTALQNAENRLHAIVTPAGKRPAKAAEKAAAGKLSQATAVTLWVGPRQNVGPPYGSNVFADTAVALADLARAPSLRNVSAAVLGADRTLAVGEIDAAHGGNSTLLSSAGHELSAGAGQAAAGHRAAAARLYGTAWTDAFAALTGVITGEVTGVPGADVADAAENALGSKQIGLGGPVILSGKAPLTAAGKPEVFYAGSEACPYCGVQRWGMIVALSQFGTFSNLHLIDSTALEQPLVRGFTFFASGYQSPYISFVPVEVFSNVPGPIGYRHLQPLTSAQHALVSLYGQGQFPFIDVDNRYLTVQSTVFPGLIAGQSWSQIAGALTRPSAVAAQAVAGEAEVLTAEICEATGGDPSSVCSQQVVNDYEAALPMLNGKGGGCPAAQDAASADVASDMRTASVSGNGPVARPARCANR